jgi:hypothetical protein
MSWKVTSKVIWKMAAIGAVVFVTAITTDTPASAAGPVISNPGTIRDLNPQPLPPRMSNRWTSPWAIRALNPQPLPPRWNRGGIRFVR